MVFGLFYRKSNEFKVPQIKQLRTPSPSVVSNPPSNHSPTQLAFNSKPTHPPPTPSPPPQSDPAPLHSLILSVPPQTLHAYALAHLDPAAPPPSPSTLNSLTSFFSTLAPPPRLHCVRCHKAFFEIENDDRSCVVPHDDKSAEVEHLGWAAGGRGRASGGAKYETLYGCCGKTVDGDGDMGPPDGWCYEGKHTTDHKRARFRADSSPHDDKLVSCERLRCHRHSPSLSPEPDTSKKRKPTGRKRARESVDVRDGSEASEPVPSSKDGGGEESDGKEQLGAVRVPRQRVNARGRSSMDGRMDLDEPSVKPVSKAKSTSSSSAKPKPRQRSAASSAKPVSTASSKPRSSASTKGKAAVVVAVAAGKPRPGSRLAHADGSESRSVGSGSGRESGEEGEEGVVKTKKKKRKIV